MTATGIVFASILYAASILLLGWRQIASPSCAFLGLLILSFTPGPNGYAILPISSSMVFGWLCVTVLVTVVTLLQPRAVRDTSLGVWYMTAGAIVGLAIGLLGFSISPLPGVIYTSMIIAVAVGTIFGYLVFVKTPAGRGASAQSGRFFNYLLAKGFPVAVTIMQAGVVLALIIIIHNM